MSSDTYESGHVVWAPDPFRQGSNPRPWLVLVAESLPYSDEEYVCAALTTSDLPDNYEIGGAWITGRNPQRTSFCSPWVVATVKHDAILDPQGIVAASFVAEMIEACVAYLER